MRLRPAAAALALVVVAACSGGSDSEPVARTTDPSALPFYDDFSTAPDGDFPTRSAVSGQTWQIRNGATGENQADPTKRMKVTDGHVAPTYTGADQLASYPEVQLPSDVTRMGADFTWEAGRTGRNGNLTMVAWAQDPTKKWPPYAKVHLQISPNYFVLQVFGPSSPKGLVTVDSWNPRQAMRTDGSTEYRVEIVFDGDRVTVIMPDGSQKSARTKDFATVKGLWPTWESFANGGSTDDARAQLHRVWADD